MVCKITAFALLILTAMCLLSCGGGGGSSTPTSTASIAGTWQVAAHSNSFNFNVTGTATIQQSGSTLSGSVVMSGTPCASTAALSGSVSGNSVTFQLQEGTQTVTFTGTVSGNTMSGTYSGPAGGCSNGDQGTWSATPGVGPGTTPATTVTSLSIGPSGECESFHAFTNLGQNVTTASVWSISPANSGMKLMTYSCSLDGTPGVITQAIPGEQWQPWYLITATYTVPGTGVTVVGTDTFYPE
jgi:hypothetical protein